MTIGIRLSSCSCLLSSESLSNGRATGLSRKVDGFCSSITIN